MFSAIARRRVIDIPLIVLLALASFYGVARAGLAPQDPMAGVGVIFAPWTSPDAALSRAAAAGGRIVRTGSFSSIVIVMPDDPGYPGRVLHDGALMVVDPRVLEACLKVLTR